MRSLASVSVPIEYRRRVHEIEAVAAPEEGAITLGELVEAVAEFSDGEHEIVATVMHMLRTGRVRIQGQVVEPPAERALRCG